jgi:hypothetical protein
LNRFLGYNYTKWMCLIYCAGINLAPHAGQVGVEPRVSQEEPSVSSVSTHTPDWAETGVTNTSSVKQDIPGQKCRSTSDVLDGLGVTNRPTVLLKRLAWLNIIPPLISLIIACVDYVFN